MLGVTKNEYEEAFKVAESVVLWAETVVLR